MRAMQPMFDVIFGLEGFEMVIFWLMLFIGWLIAGFFIDMLMQRQGFGPYINGALALLGGFLGLFLRYNYFTHAPWFRYEPFVTTGLCFGSMALLLLALSFLRNRFG